MKHTLLTLIATLFWLGLYGQPTLPANTILQHQAPQVSLRAKGQVYSPTAVSPMPSTRNCFTVENMALKAQAIEGLDNDGAFEEKLALHIKQYQQNLALGRAEETVLTIPVVVHVVHNGESVGSGANISQAQVNSQIDVLNEDFRRTGAGANSHANGADTEIQFALAVYAPNGTELSEPGINRVNGGRSSWDYNSTETNLKPNTIWDPEKYFNIWVVNFGGDASDLLGYAQFPSLSDLPGLDRSGGLAETDGVVIRFSAFGRVGNVSAPYDEGRTATHEVGHWLGLRHIWGDGGCEVDDFCDDTPNSDGPNYQCTARTSCSATNDMIENYMDYTPDGCMNIFTNDQKTRMRAVMAVSPRRVELAQSDDVIEATDAPIAQAAASSFNICEGEQVSLIDQSTNNPTSWLWEITDVDDQIVFSATTANATWNTSGLTQGNYSIIFIASNASGSDTILVENVFTILSPFEDTSISEDLEGASILSGWAIDNPDNDRGLYLSPEGYSGHGVGSYSILWDNYSADDDPTGTIDLLYTHALDFTSATNPYLSFDHAYAQYSDDYSDTLAVYYTTDCGQNYTLLWYAGGDNLATAPATQDVFYPTSEQWATTEISLNSLAGQSGVHLVFVNFSGWGQYLWLDNFSVNESITTDPVVSDFTASKTVVCVGETVNFLDQSSNQPNAWNWTFEGGTPSSATSQNPSVTYSTPGVYNVTLDATNSLGGTPDSRTDYIEVVAYPQLAVSGDLQSCPGATATLTATGGSNIRWFSRGAVIEEGPTLSIDLYEDASFSVTGDNTAGCTSSTSATVTMNEITAESDAGDGACSGDDIILTASGADNYTWTDSDGMQLGTGSTITVTADPAITFYTVEGSVASQCSLSSIIFVSVSEAPSATISTNEDGTLQASQGDSYQWYLDGEAIAATSGGTAQIITPSASGDYTVEVFNAAGCSTLSAAVSLVVSGFSDQLAGEVQVYPNPTHGQVQVTINNLTMKPIHLQVTNLQGQIVWDSKLAKTEQVANTSLDLTHLGAGVYLLIISQEEEGHAIQRLVLK